MAKQVYGFNMKRIQDAAEDGRGGADWKSWQPGDNFARLLPPWSELGDAFLETKRWWFPKSFQRPGKGSVYHYAEMGLQQSCPIQQVVDEIRAARGPDFEPLKEMRVASEFLANVLWYVNVNNELRLDRPAAFVVGSPPSVANQIYSIIIDPIQQPNVGDPMQGRILRVTKPKSFKGKENYAVTVIGTPHPFGSNPQEHQLIAESIIDLDALVAPTDKRLQTIKATADELRRQFLIGVRSVHQVAGGAAGWSDPLAAAQPAPPQTWPQQSMPQQGQWGQQVPAQMPWGAPMPQAQPQQPTQQGQWDLPTGQPVASPQPAAPQTWPHPQAPAQVPWGTQIAQQPQSAPQPQSTSAQPTQQAQDLPSDWPKTQAQLQEHIGKLAAGQNPICYGHHPAGPGFAGGALPHQIKTNCLVCPHEALCQRGV